MLRPYSNRWEEPLSIPAMVGILAALLLALIAALFAGHA